MRCFASASRVSRIIKPVEVGPRDGVQNIKSKVLSPEVKAHYINWLLRSGLRDIEVGSFVSDKVIQMKNTREVLGLIEKPPNANLIALVGNRRYAEEAVTYPILDTLAVFTSISETFCQKNNGCSTQENLSRILEIARLSLRTGKKVRGYISCVFGCPYENYHLESISKTVTTTKALLDMGCYEVSIADTIGTATESMVASTLGGLMKAGIDLKKIAIHLHDPRGTAKDNLRLALVCGVSTVDCATNPSDYIGFGGCPSVPDPSSNIDTLTVIEVLEEMGLNHSVSKLQINMAAEYINDQL